MGCRIISGWLKREIIVLSYYKFVVWNLYSVVHNIWPLHLIWCHVMYVPKLFSKTLLQLLQSSERDKV